MRGIGQNLELRQEALVEVGNRAVDDNLESQVWNGAAVAELQALDEHAAAAAVGGGIAGTDSRLVDRVWHLGRGAGVHRHALPFRHLVAVDDAVIVGIDMRRPHQLAVQPDARDGRDAAIDQPVEDVDLVGVGRGLGPATALPRTGRRADFSAFAGPPDLPGDAWVAGRPGDGLPVLAAGDAQVFQARAVGLLLRAELGAHHRAQRPADARADTRRDGRADDRPRSCDD